MLSEAVRWQGYAVEGDSHLGRSWPGSPHGNLDYHLQPTPLTASRWNSLGDFTITARVLLWWPGFAGLTTRAHFTRWRLDLSFPPRKRFGGGRRARLTLSRRVPVLRVARLLISAEGILQTHACHFLGPLFNAIAE